MHSVKAEGKKRNQQKIEEKDKRERKRAEVFSETSNRETDGYAAGRKTEGNGLVEEPETQKI